MDRLLETAQPEACDDGLCVVPRKVLESLRDTRNAVFDPDAYEARGD